MKNLLFYFTTLVLILGCASNKKTLSPQEINNFKSIINAKLLEIEFDVANPLGLNNVQGIDNLLPIGSTINNINLLGNSNHFRIIKDSVSVDIPYFGNQQLFRGYNNTKNSVFFLGKPTNEEITFSNKKKSYKFRYQLKGEYEIYTMFLTLFINKKATLSVTSSHRTAINYLGNWNILKEE